MSKIHNAIHEIIYIENYNHLDCIWGMDAPSAVYRPVIALMNKMMQNEEPKCDQC